MEDFPVRNITDNKETPLTEKVRTISLIDVELLLIEDHLQGALFKPVWILERYGMF